MFWRKKEVEQEYLRYDKVLTDNEIAEYAQLLDKFRNREIGYKELEQLFLEKGITITPNLDNQIPKMNISEAEAYEKRRANGDYLYHEIHSYVLNSEVLHNVIFCVDYKTVEVMSNRGVPYYLQAMRMILRTQLRHSSDTSKLLAAERSMWQRRIREIDKELEKSRMMQSSEKKEATNDNVKGHSF